MIHRLMKLSQGKSPASLFVSVFFFAVFSAPASAVSNKDLCELQTGSPQVDPVILAKSLHLAGNYLDELSDEAVASDSVSSVPKQDKASLKLMTSMEVLIKHKQPSTYRFYKKLTPVNKGHIFKLYVAGSSSDSDKQLRTIQKKVLDLYFTQ